MYLPSKHTKLYLLLLLWAYHPQTCITDAAKICQFFRIGLHPYKLAALRATIGLIITSCYRIELIKIKGFVTSQKLLWPAINFLMWKWPATLKRLGRPALGKHRTKFLLNQKRQTGIKHWRVVRKISWTRPVTSLGHQGGRRVFWEGPKFLNYVQ